MNSILYTKKGKPIYENFKPFINDGLNIFDDGDISTEKLFALVSDYVASIFPERVGVAEDTYSFIVNVLREARDV